MLTATGLSRLVHLGVLALLAAAGGAWAQDAADPVPIPGGLHVFAPGPRKLGLQGLGVEPSTIIDFQGDVALAYMGGDATDADGHRYQLQADMRILSGEYVSADGVHRNAAFGFV